MSAERIAEARRKLNKANDAHKQALNKVQSLADRLSAVRVRATEITKARINGNSNPQDAAEFAALSGDAELLQKMHTDAQASAAELLPAVESARNNLALVEQQHQQEQAVAEFEALRKKLFESEQLFVACLAATHQAGRKIGHHALSQTWTPGQSLQRAIHYNVAPEV